MTEPFIVVIPAAGQSIRFGGGRNKLIEPLCGQSILRRTLRAFLGRADVSGVVLATSIPFEAWAQGDTEIAERLRSGWLHICGGGGTRAESVRMALAATPVEARWVAVHDAARPLVSGQLITRVFESAKKHGASAPALPVKLTIKQATGPLPARVIQTVPREDLWAMQTPQAMRRQDLQRAFEACSISLAHVTDDVQLLELNGQNVWLVPGDENNLKVTTAIDLVIAEAILGEGDS